MTSLYTQLRSRAIIIDNDELLVVFHRGKEEFAVLPGGHLEPGETTVATLERELCEELGIAPAVGSLMYVHEFMTPTGPVIEFLYEVKNGPAFRHSSPTSSTHGAELAAWRFVKRNDELVFRPATVFADFAANTLPHGPVRHLSFVS